MGRTRQYRRPRVVITGGGTGGHIFPAIAIANALTPYTGRDQILFVGAEGKMEMERVPAAGYDIVGLPVRGIQGRLNINNLLLPFRLAWSLIRAIGVLRRFSPDVVIGVGGFASAPALLAAGWLGIPVIIQEQNSVPGKVNRWFGRKAQKVCTAFPDMERYFPPGRLVLTGNPVRKTIAQSGLRSRDAFEYYGFDPVRPVLLVVGGSQGARSLNKAMEKHLPRFTAAGIQVIWQTGKAFAGRAEEFVKENGLHDVVVAPFIERMEFAYGAASLVISRAGALSIAEIALAGLPAIFVPFPFAAGDHQARNAEAMAGGGAAKIISDNDVTDRLGDEVLSLISASERLEDMSRQMKKFAYVDADERIAGLILSVAGIRPSGDGLTLSDVTSVKQAYFLGAGGIGMSGLVRWFLLMGKSVHGYDRTRTSLTEALEKEGAVLHYDDRPELIPEATDLVVITPAIPKELNERQAIARRSLPVLKRAELLGLISRNMTTVAVAGTHGKTSTSSLIAHLLKSAGVPVTAFIGGITKNYESNFIFTPDSRYLIVEADEFDRSFLHLRPDFSIITSTDADHLDVYGNHESMKAAFRKFGELNGQDKPLFVSSNVRVEFDKPVSMYSITDSKAKYSAKRIRDEGEVAIFDLILDDKELKDVILGIPGRHNVENAVVASAAALWCGVGLEQIRSGLESYRGVRRRFDIRINKPGITYIDDYAHHPGELTACISAVRKIFPGREVTGIFQPHLFTRTRDFAQGFAESLEVLDRVILLEIYPAREEPLPGISSSMLLEMIQNDNKVLMTKEEVITGLSKTKPDVLLTLGAGDIDTLVPEIEQLLGEMEDEQ